MAEVSGLDMVREIIGQINNLRRLVTINGKKFKWDGKKYVRAVDGKKFTKKELTSFVKNQKFTAPKVPKKEKPKTKLKVKTTPKTKTNPLKIGMNKLNQFTQNQQYNLGKNTINPKRTDGKIRLGVDPGAMTKDGMTRGSRATVNNMMPGRQGGGIATMIAGSLLGEGGLDPGGHLGNWIGNRILPGPDRTLQENNALRAQLLAEKEINKQNKQLMVKGGRNWQNPYMGPPQPEITQEQAAPKKKTTSTNYVQTPSPTWGVGDKPKEELKSKKVIKKEEKKKKKNDKNKVLMIGDKKASPIQKKLLKAGFTEKELKKLVDAYDEKYRSKRGW